MNLYKKLDEGTSQLEINYIGEITIKFNDGSTGYGIPSRYWNENTVIIDVPENASFVTVKYSFTQWKIKHIPTLNYFYNNTLNIFLISRLNLLKLQYHSY